MAGKPPPARWSRAQTTMWGAAERHVLRRGITILATCQRMGGTKWFWYAEGKNTSTTPVDDLNEAKAQAHAWVMRSPDAPA